MTRANVRSGGAPRSIAASSSVQSRPRIRAFIVSATKLTQNITCAITIVRNPRSSFHSQANDACGCGGVRNNVSNDDPRTISGVVSGSTIRRLTSPPPRKR
ncbi:MAG: hypothetical protein KatS3mg009_0285 [Acidimicrobiia bacterium]|nr:MAG: hypothetical protein KatS3mg009_0285 [Acidimicrobiia bacterium]